MMQNVSHSSGKNDVNMLKCLVKAYQDNTDPVWSGSKTDLQTVSMLAIDGKT